MPDLYPTKTRLELLRAVDAGEVIRHWSRNNRPQRDNWNGDRVAARVAEMQAAGWIALPPTTGFGTLPRTKWELTDAGRKVLEEAPDA